MGDKITKNHIIKIELRSPTSHNWLKRVIDQAISRELKSIMAVKKIE